MFATFGGIATPVQMELHEFKFFGKAATGEEGDFLFGKTVG